MGSGTMKWSVRRVRAMKNGQKIAVLTAYDYVTAQIMDRAGLPVILVGDSLGMTVLGYETTLPVTMEDMLHHTAAVARGARNAVIVGDMPFLSYHGSVESAIVNAGRFIKESDADAVKIEGGRIRAPLIERLVENGIPVMGHLGLTPQSVKAMGYAVQGKGEKAAETIKEDAQLLEEAGAFAVVLESIPAELAEEVTASVSIPTIGIGAGPCCDGQVLVVQDMLGLYEDIRPKFVKRYAELGEEMKIAIEEYKREVEDGEFPAEEHIY